MKKMTDAELVGLAKRAIRMIEEGNNEGATELVRTVPESQQAYFYVSLRGAVDDKKAQSQSK